MCASLHSVLRVSPTALALGQVRTQRPLFLWKRAKEEMYMAPGITVTRVHKYREQNKPREMESRKSLSSSGYCHQAGVLAPAL